MEKTRQYIGWGIVLGLAVLFIPICINRLQFAYSVAAGNFAGNMIQSGASEEFTRQQAPRIGHISSIFYLFGVPVPAFFLLTLVLLYFLGFEINGRRIPFWRAVASVCFIACISFSLYFLPWDHRPFVNIVVGSIGLWLAIFAGLSAFVGIGNLGYKLFRRVDPAKIGKEKGAT